MSGKPDYSDLGLLPVDAPDNSGKDNYSDLGLLPVDSQDKSSVAVPPTTPSGYPNPQYSDNPPAGAEVPAEARLFQNASNIAQGYMTGQLGAKAASWVGGKVGTFFKAAPDLLNAGIKEGTILKMTPKGQNPATYGETIQSELNSSKALGKDAKETWDKVNALKEQAGKSVGNSLDALRKSGSSVVVDADKALKPILDEWVNKAGAMTAGVRRLAKPFQDIYEGLATEAEKAGGKIGLDQVDAALKEVGPMVQKGSESMRAAYGDLYHALASTRETIVNGIAQQANNPKLAKNLFDANSAYTKYMRILPDISKAAASLPIKEGASTFQKIGGPQIAKYIAAYAVGRPLVEGVSAILGGKKE